MRKCYSINNEDFSFGDLCEVMDALDSDGRLEAGTIYYEANCRPLTIGELLRTDIILEQADELGYDIIGESWDNPFSVTKAAEAELQELLDTWAAKHVDVSNYFDILSPVSTKMITASDVAEYRGTRQ